MSEFEWKVASEGYTWVESYETPASIFGPGWVGRFTGDVLVPQKWEFSTYKPLRYHTGLFQTFASTPPTLEGVLSFANKYGHLGEGGGWMTWGPTKGVQFDSAEDRRMNERFAESLAIPQRFEDWKDAILKLRKAVDLWGQIESSEPDPKAVKKLQKIVDGQLSELRIVARFEIAPDRFRKPALHLVPSTLGGAMWLQLAEAIAGNKRYRACTTCGKHFELSPEGSRTSRHYCSDACRSKAYRKRKDDANRRALDPHSPSGIARRIEAIDDQSRKLLRQVVDLLD